MEALTPITKVSSTGSLAAQLDKHLKSGASVICVVYCLGIASWQHLGHIWTGSNLWQRVLMMWWLYSASPLRDHATGTLTKYPAQPPGSDNELTSHFHIRLTPNSTLGSGKYQFCKWSVWLAQHFKRLTFHSRSQPALLPIQPPRAWKYLLIVTDFQVSLVLPRWAFYSGNAGIDQTKVGILCYISAINHG